MNKFLSRKKEAPSTPSPTPLVTDLSHRAITPSQLSPGMKKSQSKWKKNKRAPEPKIEINLNNVLPSADDFRTSLIMPNLSARFSMLREQDDPNSLIGKAMDDSVLQPRRKSRMDFGYGRGLGDIAEVSSIHSSIRPPFASHGRGESGIYEDGYDSDPNSGVMSRARPGEGNVMFGGRQKVYMIPKSGSTRNLGKPVYEDDIKQSAFQRHRQAEREAAAAKMADEARHFDFGLVQDDSEEPSQTEDNRQDLNHSPSLSSYDKKRSTNSSTARSEARSSTAATSVASQPLVSPPAPATGTMQSRPSLERANTKGRRLYEPGLDQHIHDQQNSALTRLNSIQRQRGLSVGQRNGSPYLHQTKSVGNLQEQSSQRSVYAVGTQSPPPDRRPAPLTTMGSFKSRDSLGSPSTSGAGSPLSPQYPVLDDTAVLSQALEPGDRGKATAMGAFNKPKQPFDEKQYQERQLALQRSATTATLRPDPKTEQTPFQQRIGRYEQIQDSSERAQSRSKSRGNDPRHPAFRSAAKNPNRSVTPSQLEQFSPQMTSQYSDAHRTFFGNIAASDSEDDEDDRRNDNENYFNPYGKWQPTTLPSVSEHPALRGQRSRILEEEEEEDVPPTQGTHLVTSKKDSTTLGDNLNGMISHLRSRSNASSMYPGDEQPAENEIPDMPNNARHLHAYGANNPLLRGALDEGRVSSTHSGSNPWDLEDAANERNFSRSGSISPIEPRGTNGYGSRVPNLTASQRDEQGQSQISGISNDSGSWQEQLRKQGHNRDTSTATQQERAAFDNELAARRAAIQDNIKSMVETERSASPQVGSGPFKALNMLRTKSSRDSFEPRGARSIRTAASSAAPSPIIPGERTGYSFDLTRPRGDSGSRPPLPANGQTIRALHSEQDLGRRDWSDEARPHGRSPASSTASQGGRSRSNSAATTGRSRSRTGPYRDDLEKAMVEGAGSSAAGLPDLTPFIPKELTPRPSPEIMSSHFDGSRARSGSRSYFDAKQYQPVHPSARNPNSTTPQTLTSAVYTPKPASARSSPAVSPFVQQTATPPLSGSSTPLNSSFGSQSTPANGRPLRKKTISKSDISEPTLLSTTSSMNTVNLPPGASLKNGMTEAPPVPPINPKRKTRKIFGRGESVEEHFDSRGARNNKTTDPWVTFDHINGVEPPNRGYENGYAVAGSVPERPKTSGMSGAMF